MPASSSYPVRRRTRKTMPDADKQGRAMADGERPSGNGGWNYKNPRPLPQPGGEEIHEKLRTVK